MKGRAAASPARCEVAAETEPRRRVLLELLQAALTAVDGRRCTFEALRADPLQHRLVRGPCWVAAVGKAAARMALGAGDALGGALERVLIITKDGHVDAEACKLPHVEVFESGHPVPDQRSLDAGAHLVRFVSEIPCAAQPLLLISGGASSLVEALVPGATLADLQRLNQEGLAQGLSIAALNARRREISRIKGGGLAALLAGREGIALFISDVPDDDPAVIGSGLLGPALLGPARHTGNAPPGDAIERVVVASVATALGAVRARAAGLETRIAPDRFAGAAEALAARFAHELTVGASGVCAWGGESAIELPQRPGRGGRNQHLALAVARRIAGQDLFLLAIGTDGTDGPTADAGALIDGSTCARVARAGLDVEDCLRRADSGSALAAAGDLVRTGPTGTNVGDLVMGLNLSKAAAGAWLNAAAPNGRRPDAAVDHR